MSEMLTGEIRKNYLFQEDRSSATVSIYPVFPASAAEADFQVASPVIPEEVTYSVAPVDDSSYFWHAPASPRFAEISITVTTAVKVAYRAVKRFIRHVIHQIKISLTLRRTVFLRL
jgi:hypothetical protein